MKIENKNGTAHLNSDQIKREGAHYTPTNLSNFVSQNMVKLWNGVSKQKTIHVLDPAVGDGSLLLSLVSNLLKEKYNSIEVTAYDTDQIALDNAKNCFLNAFPNISSKWVCADFIEMIIKQNIFTSDSLFGSNYTKNKYDLVIANPPYVRTQNLSQRKVKEIAEVFKLKGRVDIYYPFLVAMKEVIKKDGIIGFIVSNRFMTTRAGQSVRKRLLDYYEILEIFDFGDTKLFEAAVLPAVIIYKIKKDSLSRTTNFSSIYSTNNKDKIEERSFDDVTEAIQSEGFVSIKNKNKYYVSKGKLDTGSFKGDVWRLTTDHIKKWLKKVKDNTFCEFKDVGKVRVGVKTTADKVFIKNFFKENKNNDLPELIFPLTTHHIAQRFRPLNDSTKYQIVYPHVNIDGKRKAVDLNRFPKTKKYLEKHKVELSKRNYVINSGRNWYEIHVPQDPNAWRKTKLVFRDISEKPIFWMDFNKTIVNGDCYWMVSDNDDLDLLWLSLAIGNSSFILHFYDYMFQNKLYASRRRFITQYVERFPLPNPQRKISKEIVSLAKEIFSNKIFQNTEKSEERLDELVWESFGLTQEKVTR